MAASSCLMSVAADRLALAGRCRELQGGMPSFSAREAARTGCPGARSAVLRMGLETSAREGAFRSRRFQALVPHAFDENGPGSAGGAGDAGQGGNDDDELDRLLGTGRYRGERGGLDDILSRRPVNSNSPPVGGAAGSSEPGTGGADGNEVQDTLADLMQMEVRRVRAKEELLSDLEERKQTLRQMGEEMKAALAREYELDRLRTEMGANYHMSEAMQALDEVELEVQRIKKQVAADKADLEAFEERSAQERSKGLFFKSLYAKEKAPRQPVGKSIPGYWRRMRAEQEAAAKAAAEAARTLGSQHSAAPLHHLAEPGALGGHAPSHAAGPLAEEHGADLTPGASTWDPEAVAAAAERPLSAASKEIRSPFRLYLFSYLSAFLALMAVNDLAGPTFNPPPPPGDGSGVEVSDVRRTAAEQGPAAFKDALYCMLSAGLALAASGERQALGDAQALMLEGIRKRSGVQQREGRK
ncbi:hypothetical protein HYH03_006980 [Edaphochlamys debaryana]|uniref:Uncharacterized protein n=1 Tax=Edaphochlamys debaryana TaxID=47281 RepID=A0A835YCL8_9CHLO|nr:hypothetical protein HYH03_006980 [Edaphochlamys debaryana]|eukprot:KAG2495049.1 hypothetical protein HYH03_006980 [Edaphochlamys debaryana]